jgi:hypothetical protein
VNLKRTKIVAAAGTALTLLVGGVLAGSHWYGLICGNAENAPVAWICSGALVGPKPGRGTPRQLSIHAVGPNLGPSDLLTITLFDFPTPTAPTQYRVHVDARGRVNLPPLGLVDVNGLNILQAKRAIESEMARATAEPLAFVDANASDWVMASDWTAVRHRSDYWRLPLWAPLIASAVPTLVFLWLARRPGPGLCPSCGYDLTGAPSPTCPECGKPAA